MDNHKTYNVVLHDHCDQDDFLNETLDDHCHCVNALALAWAQFMEKKHDVKYVFL